MANENAITKIQLKTKTSSEDSYRLDDAIRDLRRGEPLVNTNNNTLIVQTEDGGGNPIIVGQSTVKFDNTLPADAIKNSADIVSFDSTVESSRKRISGNNNIKVSNNGGNLQVSYTNYSSKLHFQECTLTIPGHKYPYKGYEVIGLDKDHNGRLVIPSTYNGEKVISINFDTSTWYSTQITSISIPDSVKSINFRNNNYSILHALTSLKIPNSVVQVSVSEVTDTVLPSNDFVNLTSISIPAQLVINEVNKGIEVNKVFTEIVKKVSRITITNVTDQVYLPLSSWSVKSTCILTISGDSVDCDNLALPNNPFDRLVLDCTDIKKGFYGKGLSAVENLNQCNHLAFSDKVKSIPGITSWNDFESQTAKITIDKLPMSIETIGRDAFRWYTGTASIQFRNGQLLYFKSPSDWTGPEWEIDADTYMIAAQAPNGSISTIPKSVKYVAANCFDESNQVRIALHQDDNWDPSWHDNAHVYYCISQNLDVAYAVTSGSLTTYTINGKNNRAIEVPSLIHSTGNYGGTEDKDGIGIRANHGIQAAFFSASSDARLKENFKVYTPEKSILDLPVYKFDFINGAKNQIGCKAQDLQDICPEIVNEGDDDYLSIQESKIVYLLLEEVKRLRKEVDELRGI